MYQYFNNSLRGLLFRALIAAILVLELGLLVMPAQAEALENDSVNFKPTPATVGLSVEMGQPVIQANKTRRGYMMVSLNGFSPVDEPRLPINLAIILDRSASMSGEKIQQAKQAAIMAVERLQPGDSISVISYNHLVEVVVPATLLTERDSTVGDANSDATSTDESKTTLRGLGSISRSAVVNNSVLDAAVKNRSNKPFIEEAINQIQASGDTALFAGIAKGIAEIQKYADKNRVNRIILLSDGLANVGVNNKHQMRELGESLRAEGISVTTIGLGLDYHEDFLVALSEHSDGNHAFAENAEDVKDVFAVELQALESVVAQNVEIEIQYPNDVRPLRVLGRGANIMGQAVRVDLNQIYREQNTSVIFEVELPATPGGRLLPVAYTTMRYRHMSEPAPVVVSERTDVYVSAKSKAVLNNINARVMRAASSLNYNELTKRVVKLRDAGRRNAAEDTLKGAAKLARDAAKEYRVPELNRLAIEADSRIQDIKSTNPQDWSRARKSLKEEQFLLETQMKLPAEVYVDDAKKARAKARIREEKSAAQPLKKQEMLKQEKLKQEKLKTLKRKKADKKADKKDSKKDGNQDRIKNTKSSSKFGKESK